MKKLYLLITLGLLSVAAPIRANAASSALEEQFKTSLSHVVQAVKHAATPDEKRAILLRFATRMDQGLQSAGRSASLSVQDKQTLACLQSKFVGYAAALNGERDGNRIADSDLNAYAESIQQEMEQAPIDGGVYISGGMLLVVLLILLLVFR